LPCLDPQCFDRGFCGHIAWKVALGGVRSCGAITT
jgi:hypothetical protein